MEAKHKLTCGQCDKVILQSNLGKHVLEYHMGEEESVSPPLVSDEDSELVEFQLVSMTDFQSKEPPAEVMTGNDSTAGVMIK